MSREIRTKVVVRLLPHSLTEDAFKEVLGEDWVQACDWFSYWKGKPSAGPMGLSRAYLNFRDPDAVFRFKHAFDGHAFVNERGTQLRCSVEFAPNQRVARGTGKKDHREKTIEKDVDYKKFLEKLEEGPQNLPSAEVQLQQRETAGGRDVVVETALMEYLKEKRAKRLKKASGKSLKTGGKKQTKVVPISLGTAPAGKGGKLDKKKGGKESNRAAVDGSEEKKSRKKKEKRTRAKKKDEHAGEDLGGGVTTAAASAGTETGGRGRGKKGADRKNSKKPAGGAATATTATTIPPGAAPRILQRPGTAAGASGTAGASQTTASAPSGISSHSGQPSGGAKKLPAQSSVDTSAAGRGQGASAGSGAGQRGRGRGRGGGGGGGGGRRGGKSSSDAAAPRIVVLPRPPAAGGGGGASASGG